MKCFGFLVFVLLIQVTFYFDKCFKVLITDSIFRHFMYWLRKVLKVGATAMEFLTKVEVIAAVIVTAAAMNTRTALRNRIRVIVAATAIATVAVIKAIKVIVATAVAKVMKNPLKNRQDPIIVNVVAMAILPVVLQLY